MPGGRADSELHDAQRLEIALDAGEMGTWDWDIPTGVITWSANLERIHGFPPGSFGRSLDVFQKSIHPHDRDRVLTTIAKTVESGSQYWVEYRMLAPDGTTRYAEARGRVVRDPDGKALRMLGVCSDVTERQRLLDSERRARLEAEANQRQYRTLAETIPQQVWTATPDGALDFVNDRIVEYFGHSAADIVGAGWQDVVHPADLDGVVKRWTYSLQSGEPYEVEFRLRRADGAFRWHLGRAVAVRDTDGTVIKWLGTNTDIDDKKRSFGLMSTQIEVTHAVVNANSLDEVATRILEILCRNLGFCCAQLWVVDRGAGVLRRSAGWCDVSLHDSDFGSVARFDVMGRGVGLPGRIWESREPAWIEEIQADENFPRANVARNVGLRSAFGFPLKVRGEVSAVIELFSTQMRPRDNATLEMTATLGSHIGQFIERQTAETNLSRAMMRLNQLQDVSDTALANLPLQQLFVNLLSKICTAVGCDMSVVLLLDRKSDELYAQAIYPTSLSVPAELRIPVGDSLAGRVAAERRMLVVRNATTQNFIRPALRNLGFDTVLGQPLLTNDEVIGVLIVGARENREFAAEEIDFIQRVAHRVALAVENSSLYEEAREANRIKDRFLAVASHELKTPMTSILGWTSVLKSEPDGEFAHEALDAIESSARAQAQLVEDLLDSSRIREGKLVLKRESIDVGLVVSEAVRMVSPQAEERGVNIEYSRGPTGSAILGDTARLRQVFWNLLSNAIKFTPAGKSVKVSAVGSDQAVTVSVADEGEGIAPDFLPKVFAAFEQQNRGERGGLGLGLNIAKTIVEMHGGSIEAESGGIDRGATFRVTLPRQVAESSGAESKN